MTDQLRKAAQAALDWADVILGNDWSARPKQRLGEVAEQLRGAPMISDILTLLAVSIAVDMLLVWINK